MDNKDLNRLNKLNSDIYARDFPDITNVASPQTPKEGVPVGTAWKKEEEPAGPPPLPQPKSLFKKLFIASLIFFGVASIFAGIMFFGGYNIVSADKVDVTFSGPVSIGAGEKLDFSIIIENHNATPLLNPVLYINYPDGTKEAVDLAKDLVHEKRELDDIPAGSSAEQPSSSVLFGELQSAKEIKISVEYGIENSTAVFRKEKTYSVVLSSTPVSLTVEHPVEASSGDMLELRATIVSNSSVPMKNILVRADYPFGFVFKGSSPDSSFDNSVWKISSLAPGEKKTITVRGLVEGEENDERIFRFAVGLESEANEKQITTVFLSALESVKLRKPPVAAVLYLNDTATDTVAANQGAPVRGTFIVTNNLPIRLVDMKLQVAFSGPALDPASPQTSQGFYHSLDQTIVWDKLIVPNLAAIDPGARAEVNFSFSTLPPALQKAIKAGTVTVRATATAKRVEDTGAGETSVSVTRTVKLQSQIGLVSRIVYSIGPFKNTGQIPPKANAKTTYTIVWTATNSLNAVSGMEVRATLPTYVSWTGQTSPATEKVSWNPDKNEVVWRVGDVPASSAPTRQVAFQVALTPSTSQVGSAPVIVNGISLQATDTFTSGSLTASSPDLTTDLATDPRFGDGEDIVVR